MNFSDYLNEVFKLSKVTNGLNKEMNDRGFAKFKDKGYYTFFKIDDLYYVCMMSIDGEIGFATSTINTTKLSSYKTKKIPTKQIFKVLNYVISLIKIMIDHCNSSLSDKDHIKRNFFCWC